jgi:hypothetical protein
MKILNKALMVVTLLVVLAVGFLWYMGYFASVKIEEKEDGGYFVVGKEVIGPYSEVGKHMLEADNKLKGLGIICTKGFGIYYNDPNTTPKEKCRSLVGNIVEVKDLEKIKNAQLEGLKIDSIPKAKAVVAEFPIKNTLSYMLGPTKVYSKFSRYITEHNYKIALSFEIYDMPKEKIIFVMQYSE